MEQKEAIHTISVLEQTKQSLKEENPLKLLELSNQKIHSAACVQDIESINLTIIIYTLGKLLERKKALKIKNWNQFVEKIISLIDLAILALEKNNQKIYRNYDSTTCLGLNYEQL